MDYKVKYTGYGSQNVSENDTFNNNLKRTRDKRAHVQKMCRTTLVNISNFNHHDINDIKYQLH